jgi:hypothetical protein
MSEFTFQNRNIVLSNITVRFPEWFPSADAHILWMAVNQARVGAAGSAGKIMVSLLEKAYEAGVDQGKADYRAYEVQVSKDRENERLEKELDEVTQSGIRKNEVPLEYTPMDSNEIRDWTKRELLDVYEERFPTLYACVSQEALRQWPRAHIAYELAHRKNEAEYIAPPRPLSDNPQA